MITLTEIRVFPVKSLAGEDRSGAVVEPRGLRGDRRWMVVDGDSRFLSQRELPGMARLCAVLGEDGLRLSAPGLPPLLVAEPGPAAPPLRVRIWHDSAPALDAGEEAARWLTQALGAAVRLVFQADPHARAVRPAYARPGDWVSFADGFPLLLAGAGSLDDLNSRLAVPVPMLRFRPNLVVSGAPAWAEDTWRRLRIGAATFRVVKPCDRCVVTTIDPATGERPVPDEPLRTLRQFRRGGRGLVYFGQNLVPDVCGDVRVGDRVEVLEIGPSNLPVLER